MPLPSHPALEKPSWTHWYGLALEWLVMALMILLFLEVMLGIVYRASGHSLVWYDEVASIMLAWLTFYGSALASHKRAHIGCPEIVDKLTGASRWTLQLVTQLLVIVFFVLLAWVGFSIMPILATDTMTSLPDVPMNLVQSVIPISSVLILISEIQQLMAILRNPPDGGANISRIKGA